MRVVLPEPVAPTIAIFSPGLDAEADVAQHVVLALVGEPDVVELDRAAHAPPGACAAAGDAIAGAVSSSWKTRSADAIADCMTAYLVLNSRIGMKKRWMYSMKATSVPNAIAPLEDVARARTTP